MLFQQALSALLDRWLALDRFHMRFDLQPSKEKPGGGATDQCGIWKRCKGVIRIARVPPGSELQDAEHADTPAEGGPAQQQARSRV